MQETTSTIATCYLQKAGDDQNKIWFSREYVQLLYKGKLKVFPVQQLRRISFNQRKLMLLLVGGGITASLSLVAIIKLYYNPWITLSLLCFGCLAAYKGYLGSWVLTMEEPKFHSDFFIKSVTPNLKAFVRYANTFTGHQQPGILYLPLPRNLWEGAKTNGSIRFQETQRLYFRFELPEVNLHETVILPINSLEESIHISWKPVKESNMDIFPFLQPGSLYTTDLNPLFG